MDNLHPFPSAPLPEGWASSSLFADEWVRQVRLGTQHVALLHVHRAGPGVYDAVIGGRIENRCRSLPEAIAAVERAYCAAYVAKRATLPR